MGVTTMHVKSDSDVTSVDASSPPRSPRRPLYYVQSPSQHDVEKMSYGSSPYASPPHYHCSPIHHSRESSTSRFSASLKNTRNPAAWKRIQRHRENDADDEDEDDEEDQGAKSHVKLYVILFVLSFILLFTIFSLSLWAASFPYKPKIFVQSMVFENFNVQSGMDRSGVPTDMLTLNSTVKIYYRNSGTFFGVHVTATPLELYYYQLRLASGHMKKFFLPRESGKNLVVGIVAHQVPLYGGVPVLAGAKDHLKSLSVPVNLTFVMRSRANILGRLVKPKFYRNILCQVTMNGNRLGQHVDLKNACVYRD